MKQDPFAGLSGLDQRLFNDQAGTETRKHANTEPSVSPDRQPRYHAGNQSAVAAEPEATNEVSGQADQVVSNQPSGPAARQASRTPASSLSGQKHPVRVDERHTYDVFQDQVRWLNRLKLDLDELYNARLTINGFVKLALDILRQDYETNGDRSHLVRVLIRGRALEVQRPNGEKSKR